MKMSKSERKYRAKFIAEMHYNKEEQREFDLSAPKTEKSFKELYKMRRNGNVFTFMAVIAAGRLSRSLSRMGTTADVAAASLTEVCRVAQQVKYHI